MESTNGGIPCEFIKEIYIFLVIIENSTCKWKKSLIEYHNYWDSLLAIRESYDLSFIHILESQISWKKLEFAIKLHKLRLAKI